MNIWLPFHIFATRISTVQQKLLLQVHFYSFYFDYELGESIHKIKHIRFSFCKVLETIMEAWKCNTSKPDKTKGNALLITNVEGTGK